jgi:hypothetical protein
MLINVILVALGFLTASVVFLIAAVVVILLKVKGTNAVVRQIEEVYRSMSDQENAVSGRFDEVYRSVSDQEDATSGKFVDVYRTITDRFSEASRLVDGQCASVLKDANSYTDSRIDKMASGKK